MRRSRRDGPLGIPETVVTLWVILSAALGSLLWIAPVARGAGPEGEAIYRSHCAVCHDHAESHAPPVSLFRFLRTPEDVLRALTIGVMRQQGVNLSTSDRRAVATYLTGRSFSETTDPDPSANQCTDSRAISSDRAGIWDSFARDSANTAYQPHPGIGSESIRRLHLKWVFAYPGGMSYGQPTVAGGRVYISTVTGRIFALNAHTGCTYWWADIGVPVRSTVVFPGDAGRRPILFFADERATVYALDATTGRQLWATKIDDHPLVRVTGAVKLYNEKLYVPLSSQEELGGADARYPCCTFRGAIAALDAATGQVLWKSYTIQETPKPFAINSAGTQMFGPAGAAIWTAPTIDTRRHLLYVATGNSYTRIATDATDAVVAFDLNSGERKWVSQVRADDNWQGGCTGKEVGNCPSPLGPDFDFRTPPVLQTSNDGRQVIVAGSKSGFLYAFDPDRSGKILWKTKLGEGAAIKGGIFGPAVDGRYVYCSATHVADQTGGNAVGETVALDAATGRRVWRTPNPGRGCSWGLDNCSEGQKSALAAIQGFVFAGGLDGHIRAYRTDNGEIVWDFDTGHAFRAVNGGDAMGGAIGDGGEVVVDGMLFVNSGSRYGKSGNALIAFGVDGR